VASGEDVVMGTEPLVERDDGALSTSVETKDSDAGLRRRNQLSRTVSQPEPETVKRSGESKPATAIDAPGDSLPIIAPPDQQSSSPSSSAGTLGKEEGMTSQTERESTKRKGWFSSSPKLLSTPGPVGRSSSAPTTVPSSPSRPSKAFSKTLGAANGADSDKEPPELEAETAASAAAKVREALESARNSPQEEPPRDGESVDDSAAPRETGDSASHIEPPDSTWSSLPSSHVSPSPNASSGSRSVESLVAESLSPSPNPSSASNTPTVSGRNGSPSASSSKRQFPPPPRRHQSTVSVDSGNSSPPGLVGAWRSRPTDRQALTASVNQARDVMKRWGANWNSVRKNEGTSAATGALFSRERREEILSTREDGATVRSDSTSRSSPERTEELVYDQRRRRDGIDGRDDSGGTSTSSREGDDDASKATTSSSSSPPVPIAALPTLPTAVHPRVTDEYARGRRTSLSTSPHSRGMFTPPPSAPTTGLSKAPPFSHSRPKSASSEPVPIGVLSPDLKPTTEVVAAASPSSQEPPVVTERVGYQPKPTMSIPGISDASHRFAMGSELVVVSKEPGRMPPKTGSSLVSNFLRRSSTASTLSAPETVAGSSPPPAEKGEMPKGDRRQSAPEPDVVRPPAGETGEAGSVEGGDGAGKEPGAPLLEGSVATAVATTEPDQALLGEAVGVPSDEAERRPGSSDSQQLAEVAERPSPAEKALL
jgi:hypothetical protein